MAYKADMKSMKGGREPASTARHFQKCRSDCCHEDPVSRLPPKTSLAGSQEKQNLISPQKLHRTERIFRLRLLCLFNNKFSIFQRERSSTWSSGLQKVAKLRQIRSYFSHSTHYRHLEQHQYWSFRPTRPWKFDKSENYQNSKKPNNSKN